MHGDGDGDGVRDVIVARGNTLTVARPLDANA